MTKLIKQSKKIVIKNLKKKKDFTRLKFLENKLSLGKELTDKKKRTEKPLHLY